MEIEFAFRFDVKLAEFELNFEVQEHFEHFKIIKCFKRRSIQSFHIKIKNLPSNLKVFDFNVHFDTTILTKPLKFWSF